jgi:hypothetical protein
MAFTAAPPVQKFPTIAAVILGPRRDAAFEDAVVPGADDHCRALREGRALTCHPGEPLTENLQTSQTTRRLGEPEVSPSRFFGGGLVGRRYFLG